MPAEALINDWRRFCEIANPERPHTQLRQDKSGIRRIAAHPLRLCQCAHLAVFRRIPLDPIDDIERGDPHAHHLCHFVSLPRALSASYYEEKHGHQASF